MSASPLAREMALRVGLAARVLPEIDAPRLLGILDELVGLPLSAKKLESVTVLDLKKGLSNLDDDDEGSGGPISTEYYKQAIKHLWGDKEDALELPEPVAYQEGDMPNSVRVACGSNRGDVLDGHFGSCPRFLIYQVSKDEAKLVDVRSCAEGFKAEDKNAYRANLVADCDIMYVQSVGGPAAAKVVKAGIHPIKRPQAGPAIEAVNGLQAIMAGNPPPWLAKSMGVKANMKYTASDEEE